MESEASSFYQEAEKKIGFQQIAMRMSERWPALEALFTPEVCIAKLKNLHTYYRNEKQKLSSFRSGTGERDLVPKWGHFARLQFLDDTIKPLDSTSNLDNMELEVNATSLNVSDEDLFENVVELPPIPNRAPSQSELPQGIRVFTSTPPVSTSTPRMSTSTSRAKKERLRAVKKLSIKGFMIFGINGKASSATMTNGNLDADPGNPAASRIFRSPFVKVCLSLDFLHR
ncbi:hypothetical protein TNCV_1803261 [Trichonephila clavipes]|uniref:MADF domain-containing protein n=1 Tax=Trichonephila clavipes TaxID=2585209 RepID=A0A8X6SLE5_TRICX|nr:hypothetical protein TNCV_1803261 [Trichonephila clavipes]